MQITSIERIRYASIGNHLVRCRLTARILTSCGATFTRTAMKTGLGRGQALKNALDELEHIV